MSEETRSAIVRIIPFVIVLAVITILIRNKKTNKQTFYLNKPVSYRTYFIWVGIFLIYSVVTDLILNKTGNLEVEKWNHAPLPSVILIIGAVILGPITEELLFRSRILDLMIKWFKNLHLANFVQACIFVLLHHFTYLNTKSSYIDIVQSLGDAILYGYARIFTKSIYTSATMHMTGNLIAILERFIC